MNHPLDRRLRLHVQGPEHRFRAICHPGFESTVARELLGLGIAAVDPDFGAVEFNAKYGQVCALQAFARTPSRFIMRIADWHAENFGQLEKGLAAIAWELYLPSACVPEIDVTCHKSRLYHSDAVAQRAVAVIARKTAEAPMLVPLESASNMPPPPQRVFLRLEQDRCIASLDLSGELLYKRGNQRFVEDAPLRETMAAGILLAAGFHCYTKLIDPMAGSGVFSLEAAQWLHGPHPGNTRSFACQSQPAFKSAAYAHALSHARPAFPAATLNEFYCADLDTKACATIAHNASVAHLSTLVQPVCADFFSLPASTERSLIVLNPPYGKRLQTDPLKLYAEIGKKIRADFSTSAVAIICPTPQSLQALRITPDSVIQTQHGGLKVSVLIKQNAPSQGN